MIEKKYVNKLAPFMEAFMEFKHSLGWKYETGEFYLREFDGYYAKNESDAASLKDNIKS